MKALSKENYLKIIYNKETETNKPVSTSFLAVKLGVSKAAISDMAKRLAEESYILYEPYHGIKILPKGKKIAIDIIRKHRLWELFLAKTLKLSWTEVHEEAEMLEHTTSLKLIDRIDEFLGFPDFDPHGDPIPNKRGKFPKTDSRISLFDSLEGVKYKVSRVDDASKEVIDYLSRLGIKLGSVVRVEKKLINGKDILIKHKANIFSLSEQIASSVFVSPNGKRGRV